MSKITNNAIYENFFVAKKMPVNCLICTDGELSEYGHIIPKFVMRWLKHASGLNSFYLDNDPALKVSDTPAIKILCNVCEDRLGIYEKNFTDNYFKKFYRKQSLRPVRDELYIFAISVAWRIVVTTGFLKDTEKTIDQFTSIYTSVENEMRSFLQDFNYNCELGVYIFSAEEIINNVHEGRFNKKLLLYTIRQGLKAHNLYSKNGAFLISKSRIPIIHFKLGFYYFFVAPSGYFDHVQYSVKSKKASSLYDLSELNYTEDLLGFIKWIVSEQLYEVDCSSKTQAFYERRNLIER
jgi:hypothetical protein